MAMYHLGMEGFWHFDMRMINYYVSLGSVTGNGSISKLDKEFLFTTTHIIYIISFPHLGRIYASINCAIIGVSGNDLSPVRRQAITWADAVNGTPGGNF